MSSSTEINELFKNVAESFILEIEKFHRSGLSHGWSLEDVLYLKIKKLCKLNELKNTNGNYNNIMIIPVRGEKGGIDYYHNKTCNYIPIMLMKINIKSNNII